MSLNIVLWCVSQETAVKAIDEISARGPTNISAGVTAAIDQFKAEFKRRWVTRCMDCGETIRVDHRVNSNDTLTHVTQICQPWDFLEVYIAGLAGK